MSHLRQFFIALLDYVISVFGPFPDTEPIPVKEPTDCDLEIPVA